MSSRKLTSRASSSVENNRQTIKHCWFILANYLLVTRLWRLRCLMCTMSAERIEVYSSHSQVLQIGLANTNGGPSLWCRPMIADQMSNTAQSTTLWLQAQHGRHTVTVPVITAGQLNWTLVAILLWSKFVILHECLSWQNKKTISQNKAKGSVVCRVYDVTVIKHSSRSRAPVIHSLGTVWEQDQDHRHGPHTVFWIPNTAPHRDLNSDPVPNNVSGNQTTDSLPSLDAKHVTEVWEWIRQDLTAPVTVNHDFQASIRTETILHSTLTDGLATSWTQSKAIFAVWLLVLAYPLVGPGRYYAFEIDGFLQCCSLVLEFHKCWTKVIKTSWISASACQRPL